MYFCMIKVSFNVNVIYYFDMWLWTLLSNVEMLTSLFSKIFKCIYSLWVTGRSENVLESPKK